VATQTKKYDDHSYSKVSQLGHLPTWVHLRCTRLKTVTNPMIYSYGMVKNYYGISLKTKAQGVKSERAQYFTKRREWIDPAPRASDSRRQRQCGVPTSVETKERQKKKQGGGALQCFISGWPNQDVG
jgi:hypothetical protein